MIGGYRDWATLEYTPATRDAVPRALAGLVEPGMVALDVGCHHGAAARFLAAIGINVLGIDVNKAAIEAARKQAHGFAGHLDFEVRDFLEDHSFPYPKIDAVVLNRFLTCLILQTEWNAALARSYELLSPGGYLYVNDFLLMEDCPHNRARYEKGLRSGLPWGTFAVLDSCATPVFLAHHHSDEEVARIAQRYVVAAYRRYSTTSRNGHESRMFELVGRKPTEAEPGDCDRNPVERRGSAR